MVRREHSDLRNASIRLCADLGLPVPISLPELESELEVRPLRQLADRALAMHAAVACAHGLPASVAQDWIQEEGVAAFLSGAECDVISGSAKHRVAVMLGAHALYVFSWMMGARAEFNPYGATPENLVHDFPNLKLKATSERFREACTLRKLPEILSVADNVYCLHWACRELQFRGRSAGVESVAIEYRRRALEWALGSDSWDAICLDT